MANQYVNVKLSELAEGGLQERFNHELAKVVENCMDLNTDAGKKRKITINITVSMDEFRQDIKLDFETKSTLAPRENVGTRVLIDKSGDDIFANELRSGQRGQMYFDPSDATLKDDKGTPVEEIEKEQTKQEDIIEEQGTVQQVNNIHSFKKKAEI